MASVRNEPGRNALVRGLSIAGGLVLVALFASMVAVLVHASLPVLSALGSEGANTWRASRFTSPILGSGISAAIALLVAAPLSLGTALYISEFAPPRVAVWMSTVLEVMGAVPTLVFGMWGLVVFSSALGRFSVDAKSGSLISEGGSVLLAGLVLAVMLLPYLANIERRLLSKVPFRMREAAIAVGANKWEIIRFVVLPHVRFGLLGATVLGLGRAMGETMAVVLLIGNRPSGSSSTIATVLLNELHPGSPVPPFAFLALFLLVITMVAHALGRTLVRRSVSEGVV